MIPHKISARSNSPLTAFFFPEQIASDPALNASDLSTLPSSPSSLVLGGNQGNSAFVQLGTSSLEILYDFETSGSYAGSTVTFDDYGTAPIETADLSGLDELVFGASGPDGATLKLEFEGYKGGVLYNEIKYLTGLTAATQYFRILKSHFNNIDWNQMRSISFVVEKSGQPVSRGVVKLDIQGLKDPSVLNAAKELMRNEVIGSNARYFTSSTSVNQATQFPYDHVSYDPATGVPVEHPWTQPTSIGFHAQILADAALNRIGGSGFTQAEAVSKLSTLVTSLRSAQQTYGWNYQGQNQGLLPWFQWVGGVMSVVSDPVIGLGDNSNLAQSLAVMIGALESGSFTGQAAIDVAAIITTATTILTDMERGFETFYDSSVGLFHHDYNVNAAQFNGHVDRLTNEFRATIAFLVTYYGIDRSAWDGLTLNSSAYSTTYTDSQDNVIPVVAPYQGAAFQMFWPMLRTNEQDYVELQGMMKNFLYASADYAAENNIPGLPSAGYVPGRNNYSGSLGIAELSETQMSGGYTTANVGNIYALASAFAMDPNFVIDWLYEIEHQSSNFIRTAYGYYDSIISNSEVGRAHYAIDQATIVLALGGHEGDNFDTFLRNRGLYDTFRGLYRSLDLDIAQTSYAPPAPPTFPTETLTVFNRFNQEGPIDGSFMTGFTQEYGVHFQYTSQTTAGSHYWRLSQTLNGVNQNYDARGRKLRISYSVENSPQSFSIILRDSSGNAIGAPIPVTVDDASGIHTLDLLIPGVAKYANVARIDLWVNPSVDPDHAADFYIHALQFRNS